MAATQLAFAPAPIGTSCCVRQFPASDGCAYGCSTVRRGGILERCWSLRVERILPDRHELSYMTVNHLFILRFFPSPRARVTFRPHAVQFRPEPAVGQLDALHGAQGESDPTPKAFGAYRLSRLS